MKSNLMNFKLKVGFLLILFSAIMSPFAFSQKAVSETMHNQSESLDSYIVRLKSVGSLSLLCEEIPSIRECVNGIGRWRLEELNKIKMNSLICFDQCPLDQFGFYRNHVTGLDVPAVRTKDFDGSAPSRGHLVTMYPIAIKVVRYEGCAGCELTYTYPLRLIATHAGKDYQLPRISRSGFYVPSRLRQKISQSPHLSFVLKTSTSKVYMGAKAGKEETIAFSKKAMNSYAEMLRLLKFDR